MIHKVSEIPNLPYGTFGELQKDYEQGKIDIIVDMTVAREWMFRGKHSPQFWRFVSAIMHVFPVVVYLATFVLPIVIGKPLFALVVIPLVLTTFIFVPSCPIRRFVDITCVILLVLFAIGLIFGKFALVFVPAPFLVVWIASKLLYRLSVAEMIKSSVKNEELFCYLFQRGSMRILFNKTGDVLKAQSPWP